MSAARLRQSATVSVASEELSASINESLRQIAESTRVVQATVAEAQKSEKIGRSTTTVLGVAQSLARQAAGLEEKVDSFLASVRAM